MRDIVEELKIENTNGTFYFAYPSAQMWRNMTEEEQELLKIEVGKNWSSYFKEMIKTWPKKVDAPKVTRFKTKKVRYR